MKVSMSNEKLLYQFTISWDLTYKYKSCSYKMFLSYNHTTCALIFTRGNLGLSVLL